MWRVLYVWLVEGKELSVPLIIVGVWQIWCSINLFRYIRRAKLNLEASANAAGSQHERLWNAQDAGQVPEDVLQADMQRNGQHDDNVAQHVYYAHALFYTACLGPLWARLFEVHEKGMGTYGRMVMKDHLDLSDNTCFVVYVAAQVLLPNILMFGSLTAKRKGTFI